MPYHRSDNHGPSRSPIPVLIGLGGNLPSQYGDPKAGLAAVLPRLAGIGVRILARSPWYESEPVPPSDQPWYINAVISGETSEEADILLSYMHKIEEDWGRRRSVANAARPLDLDLLAYGEHVTAPAAPAHGVPVLPHPRMQDRAFVLAPLAAIAPQWRHPRLGRSAAALLAELPPGPGLRLARTFDAVR